MADEDGFLRRWSRRKQEARLGREPDPDALPEPTPEAPAGEGPAGRDDARREEPAKESRRPAAPGAGPVSLASLPDIASLGPDSDFRAFMQPGVPPELRTQALRRLWRVKSKVGNPEMLLDYNEDYTDAARVVKGLKTLYRVGRGVLTDAELAASEAERAPRPDAPDAAAPPMAATDSATPPGDEAETATEESATEESARHRPAASDSKG